ncbi:MAG TPA: fused MFS/spermidine synthase, partial [Bryobacteraceae bacterium]|nr:fused MFS/spermidine synthase [Bryobacteraceae bacterium]
MTTQWETDSRTAGMARWPVLLLFAGSGCAALIYEIVWFQLLQLAIGSTSVSTGILLATYMGGLCLGSLALPRLIPSAKNPLLVYAALEAGTALFGLLALIEIPAIQRVYFASAEHGLPSMLLRGAIAAVCLLPPTILMGASLPAIVRWIEATPRGISWWGLLYGGNTAGAVFGCLLAGFYLLRIHDTYVATYVAAAINLTVALFSFAMSAWTGVVDVWAESRVPVSWSIYVYLTIALSGACALGAEVIWTRLLGMMLGSTVYVFSIILAVFLIGLALGSGAASWWLRARSGPESARQALGWCQILLAGGIAWTAYMVAVWMPSMSNAVLLNGTPWQTFRVDLARCALAILPPTLLWGASFPLACAAAAGYRADSGRLVAAVYAANTLGAIVGALGVSLILVPWIGTQQSQRVLLIVSAASALFMLAPRARHSRGLAAGLVVALIAAGVLVRTVTPFPGKVIAYGRRASIADGTVIYTKEGRNSSVAITMWSDGAVEVDVNGHVEATTEPYDMKLQRMVGHLPALLHPHPRSVLGIGFGAGVSAGTFTRYPGIAHITVCEIEPAIPPTSTRYFSEQDYDVLNNPKTRIVYDDA